MILALTPLAFENEALRAHLGARANKDLVLASGGHGKVQFALTAQKLCLELKPRLLVCAGAAGALTNEVGPLDVVAAEKTVEHDFNLRFEKKPLPSFAGDLVSLERLRAVKAWANFRLHFGTIASGDEDVVDERRAKEVRTITSGVAVAWEGAGGARAAAACKIPYLELRVITDSCNASAPADFRRHLREGMKNLGSVLEQLL